MSRIALYRKYRSQTFGDLIGQEHVVRTLQNAVKAGTVNHAFLFTGPRGTGKTSSARLLAKVLNCPNQKDGEPCNECELCTTITDGHCMDVLEIDAASEAGVEDVRRLIVDVIEYRPTVARYKIFIIDEVHDLSSKAFDALLKTIEEPPEHIVFILATTELHKVPATIQSRCQKFQFNRASIQDIYGRLAHVLGQEGVEFEPAAVQIIARMADGGFRDGLSLLEQALVTADGKLSLQSVLDQLGLIPGETVDELLVSMAGRRPQDVLRLVDEIYRTGRDAKAILEAMLQRLSEMTRASFGVEVGASGEAALEAALRATASQLGIETILRLRELCADGIRDVRDVSLPRLWLESHLLSFGLVPVAEPALAPRAAQTTPARSVKVELVEEAPKEPVAAGPVETSPELAEAAKLWAQATGKLIEQSKLAASLLQKTRPTKVDDQSVTITFARKLDMDQFQDKQPKLLAAVRTGWEQARGDKEWSLVFEAERVTTKLDSNAAVELPAEGARLAEMTKEVFEHF